MADDDKGSQDDSKASDDDTKGDDKGGNDQSSQDASQSSQKGSDDTSSNDTVSRADFEALDKRMRAADQRADAAEKKNKERDRADQSELEKAQGDLTDITAERDSLQKTLTDARIENAFFKHNKHAWHDPSDALRLIEMENVDIDKDGKVKGLDSAIDKLAKAKPHLIKSSTDDDSDDDDARKDDDSSAASGSPRNGKRKGSKDKPDKAAYAKRFPALDNR